MKIITIKFFITLISVFIGFSLFYKRHKLINSINEKKVKDN
jgi:hypothetical protein